ncbi:MAG: hypothetical protein PQJ60_13440 [Spirochaetales bacterium]|nr:hypothetical protein [Spirochaetales bacterium]
MPANFRTPGRDQIYLIPLSLEEWIPENDRALELELQLTSEISQLMKKAKNPLPWIKDMAETMQETSARNLYRLGKLLLSFLL